MKAVIWEAINRLRFDADAPKPTCREDWVILKVMSAGVCSTDVHMITGRFENGEPPVILGHEICGVVTEVGSRVTTSRVGDRVVVETAVSCGHCIHCETGNKHLCPECHEIGFTPYNGGYAQYVTVPASCLHKIPDSMSFDEGGILEAVVCPFGAIYRMGMKPGQTVLVQGVGVAGLSYIQAVKCFSAAKVIAAARNPASLEQAKRFGADVVINVKEEDLTQRVMEETEGRGVDLSIDAAGASNTIENAVKLCASGGRCLLYGLPAENASIQFPVKEIIMRQLTVTGATNNQLAWDPLICLIASGKFNVKDMVSRVYRLEELETALQTVAERPDGFIKAVVHPWDDEAAE